MRATSDHRPPFFAAVLSTPAATGRRSPCAQVGPECSSLQDALHVAREAHGQRTDPKAEAFVTLYQCPDGLPEALIDYSLDGRPQFVGGVGPGAPKGYTSWIAEVNQLVAGEGIDPVDEGREDMVDEVRRARTAFGRGVPARIFASDMVLSIKPPAMPVDEEGVRI